MILSQYNVSIIIFTQFPDQYGIIVSYKIVIIFTLQRLDSFLIPF